MGESSAEEPGISGAFDPASFGFIDDVQIDLKSFENLLIFESDVVGRQRLVTALLQNHVFHSKRQSDRVNRYSVNYQKSAR